MSVQVRRKQVCHRDVVQIGERQIRVAGKPTDAKAKGQALSDRVFERVNGPDRAR